MKSKTKIIITSTVVFIIICGLGFILRPLSFDTSFKKISIKYSEPASDGTSAIYTAMFDFTSHDAEFEQIKQILRKYTFHQGLKTKFMNSVSWEGPGYSISINMVYENKVNVMTITKSPYLAIGQNIYRMGYWNNTIIVALGSELIEALGID